MEAVSIESNPLLSVSDLYLPVIKQEHTFFHHVQYFRRLDLDKFKFRYVDDLPDELREVVLAYYRDMASGSSDGVAVRVEYRQNNDTWRVAWNNGRLLLERDGRLVIQVGNSK